MRGSGDFDFIPAENKRLLAPSSTAGPSPFPRGGRGTGLKAYTRSSGLALFRLPCVKEAVAKRLRDCTFSLGLPYCTVWGLRFSASPKSSPTSRGLRAFKPPFPTGARGTRACQCPFHLRPAVPRGRCASQSVRYWFSANLCTALTQKPFKSTQKRAGHAPKTAGPARSLY